MEAASTQQPMTPQVYVHLTNADGEDMESEEFAFHVPQQLEQEALLQGDRGFVKFVYICYALTICFSISIITSILITYNHDWDLECDRHLKIWSLVCMTRVLLQVSINSVVTTFRLKRRPAPAVLITLARILQLFGFAWWAGGIKVVLYTPTCADQTPAAVISYALFWSIGALYALPFFIYALLCLFLPCIIYFLVRFAVRPADRQPTPQEILDQLEVKSYGELVNSLRQRYYIDIDANNPREGSILPSLSLENVIGGVSTLLGSNRNTSNASPRSDTGYNANIPENHTPISINQSCPICMVDLHDDDRILIMPCDQRHFFHKLCVEHWLETSQACPICRANIVFLLTGGPTDPNERINPRGSVELQV